MLFDLSCMHTPYVLSLAGAHPARARLRVVHYMYMYI
jgi:hypothetical protein